MKQFNVLWSGREYNSLENCVIAMRNGLLDVRSSIVGWYRNEAYRVNYSLSTNTQGEVASLHLEIQHNTRTLQHELLKRGDDGWKHNGNNAPEFKGCVDVDISLSPLTNTLPINRLSLSVGDSRVIRVIYFDLLSDRIHPVSQRYTRLSNMSYRYENVPNDFEAIIIVDEHGIVAGTEAAEMIQNS
jgi:hypothetical protein